VLALAEARVHETARGFAAIALHYLPGSRPSANGGTVADARIEQELLSQGIDWITTPRAPTIQKLRKDDGPLQLALFDEKDLADITHPD
jgi:hypothetical protein